MPAYDLLVEPQPPRLRIHPMETTPAPRTDSDPTTQSFFLESRCTGTTYTISTRVPDAMREPGPWPVMIFMDGDDQFAPAVGAYQSARAAQEIPPLLLVGVGYGASYRSPRNKRARDYTPVASALEPGSGGADTFLDFLTGELWPELKHRLPVRDDARGIAGHSLGSLLVLHALFQRHPFFNYHLASAPSIWWEDRAILCHARRLREQQAALPARLHLSVGEEDTASMTGDLDMLEEQLAAHPFEKLTITSQRFPDRNHFDVLPEAIRAGLGALFTSYS